MSSYNDKPTGVWLQNGGLLYRLEKTRYGLANCDEINITQVAGSRATPAREARAEQLMKMMQAEGNNQFGELLDCFDAAFTEGLYEALAETTDTRLKDLVERRLIVGYWKAIGPSPAKKGGAV